MCNKGNGKRAGRNAFSAKAQQHKGILAAGKQQRRIAAFGRHFAQDVNRLALQSLEVGQHAAFRLGLAGDPARAAETGTIHCGFNH